MPTIEDEIIDDLHYKIENLQERILMDRKKLRESLEFLCKERDVWGKELKEEQGRIRTNEKCIEQKEKKLNELRTKHSALENELLTVIKENAKLNEDFETLKKQQEDEINDVRLQLESMESDFHKVEVKLQEVGEMNRIIKKCHERDLVYQASEADKKFKKEMEELQRAQWKEKEELKERLKDLQKNTLGKERNELEKLKTELCLLKEECDQIEKNNRELEAGIETMAEDGN